MLKGRHTCEQLKAIRTAIAKANDIDYTPAVCKHQGFCRGTCPLCEAERSYIEHEISLRQKAGKAVKIVGLASSLLALSAQPIAAQEHQEMNSDSLVWETYFFDFGGIKPENQVQIEEMAEFVSEYPDKLYLMIGHTDARGSSAYNIKLSQARAHYVANWVKDLTKNDKITIIPVGLGFFRPHILNATNESEHEQNRRASLEIYNPKGFNGINAAMVELAIYRYMRPKSDTKLPLFEEELEKLNKKAYTPKRAEKYEKLAAAIRKAREKH